MDLTFGACLETIPTQCALNRNHQNSYDMKKIQSGEGMHDAHTSNK